IEDRRDGIGWHQGLALARAARQDAGRGVEGVVKPLPFAQRLTQQQFCQHVALPPQTIRSELVWRFNFAADDQRQAHTDAKSPGPSRALLLRDGASFGSATAKEGVSLVSLFPPCSGGHAAQIMLDSALPGFVSARRPSRQKS